MNGMERSKLRVAISQTDLGIGNGFDFQTRVGFLSQIRVFLIGYVCIYSFDCLMED